MTLFDLILFIILFGFVWFGFWYGLIYSLGGIVSLLLSTIFASRLCESLGRLITPLLAGHQNLAVIVSFILIFVLVRLMVSLIFKILDRFFHLPILGLLNKIFGGVFGLLEGALFLGLILYFSTKFPLGEKWLETLSNSFFSFSLIRFGKILLPLIPEAIKNLKSLM